MLLTGLTVDAVGCTSNGRDAHIAGAQTMVDCSTNPAMHKEGVTATAIATNMQRAAASFVFHSEAEGQNYTPVGTPGTSGNHKQR